MGEELSAKRGGIRRAAVTWDDGERTRKELRLELERTRTRTRERGPIISELRGVVFMARCVTQVG